MQASVVEPSTKASSHRSEVTTLTARSIAPIDPAAVLNETFELGYTGSALLTRPEALINKEGEVIHDPTCPCATSSIMV